MSLFVTQLQESFSLFKAGQYDKCLLKLKEAKAVFSEKEDNSNVTLEDYLMFEGGVFYHLKRYPEALSSFEAALKENPKSSATCLHLGKTLIQLDELEAAKTMLEYAVLYDSQNSLAAELLAKLEEEPAAQILPTDEKDSLDSALKLFEQKNYSESLQVLTAVEAEYKELLASVYNFKGFNLLALRQTEKAKEAFEQAMRINPHSSQAYAGMGEVMYLQNKDAESTKMFQKAVELNPNNQFAISGLKKAGQFAPASEVSDIDLGQIEAAIEKAFGAYSTKQFDESLQILSQTEKRLKAIKNVDGMLMSRLLNFKGFSYLGKQDKDSARTTFEEALKINPDSSQSATGLGEVFYMENNLKAAKEMYEWGIKLNPENKLAVSCLAKVNALL